MMGVLNVEATKIVSCSYTACTWSSTCLLAYATTAFSVNLLDVIGTDRHVEHVLTLACDWPTSTLLMNPATLRKVSLR